MAFKRRKKSGRQRGSQTHGRGAKERTRASGNRGGYGLAGTGKRADHKKTFFINLLGGNNYFGKDRTLRRGATAPKLDVINLDDLSRLYGGQKEIKLAKYKILGDGELTLKATIYAGSASASAKEKIEKAGSKLILPNTDAVKAK
jgi:large subunit ribosomal protein L15